MTRPVHIRVHPRTIPLGRTFTISRGSMDKAHLVHVRLEHDGAVGWGEASPSPSVTGESYEGVVRALRGLDPQALDPDDLPGSVERVSALPPAARAAVDLALHDLAGRRSGTPVHELLGLPEGELPTAVTVTLDGPDEAARQAREWMARIFFLFKVKLGPDAERSLAAVDAVSRLLSTIDDPERLAPREPGVWVDANEAWDLSTARRLVPTFEERGVSLVEQPLPRDQLDASAELADTTGLPIVLDEPILGVEDVVALEGLPSNLGINVKVQKVGGLAPAVACIREAERQGRKVLVGCSIETGLGIAAGAALIGAVDWLDLDGNLWLAEDPFPFPRGEPGLVATLEGAGLGIHPDLRHMPPALHPT